MGRTAYSSIRRNARLKKKLTFFLFSTILPRLKLKRLQWKTPRDAYSHIANLAIILATSG
jgi:hypothetical protein